MGTIDVDGLRIAYERQGEGPPLVLLPGFVGTGVATWRRQLDALADEFTVVVWDAPGAGGSDDPPEGFGLAGYADTVAGFLDRLGLHHPHVAGLSFGGVLALALFARHRAVPATLTLVSGYAGWGGSLPGDVARERLEQCLLLADAPVDEVAAELLPSMFSVAAAGPGVEEFAASVRDAFHPAGFRAMARASAADLSAVLPQVDVPTLIVHGDKDVRAPRPVAEHLRTAITGSTLEVLPGAGHMCSVEAPVALNRVLRRFLRAHSDVSPLTGRPTQRG